MDRGQEPDIQVNFSALLKQSSICWTKLSSLWAASSGGLDRARAAFLWLVVCRSLHLDNPSPAWKLPNSDSVYAMDPKDYDSTMTRHAIMRPESISVKCLLAFVLGLAAVSAPRAQAQTFAVIHNFTGASGGANPLAGLTIDGLGNLYVLPVPAGVLELGWCSR
jgi:hypothetical protein